MMQDVKFVGITNLIKVIEATTASIKKKKKKNY